ncbi:hypothetical protein [Limimaricola litoreus]|uniref:Uncharacterized protein n=1 Tax=Limimaricola litoreus TaxID=2955316 RepID=A0A9X2FPD8_9RHOB|nr:hypothetical protein [Limimaricola litoreus]MCP1169024.1 hypothetical protein [Limimaricola litoreus]
MIPDKSDSEAARDMAQIYAEIGPVAVKHGPGSGHGVAVAGDGGILVYPRIRSDPLASLKLSRNEATRFQDWQAVAAAGWRVD